MTLAPWLAFLIAIPDDAPPDLAPIIAGLEKTESMIRDLAVTTQYGKLQKLDGDKPLRTGLWTEFLVTRDGKMRYECQAEQVHPGIEEVTRSLVQTRAAWDGSVMRWMSRDLGEPFRSGSILKEPMGAGVNPLEYTTHFFGKPVSSKLKEQRPTYAGHAQSDGRPVVIVETSPRVTRGVARRLRFGIDTERRVVLRRAALVRDDGGRWQEYARTESRDHKEISPGIWLPMRFLQENVKPAEGGEPEEVRIRFEGTNSDWKVNQDPPASAFLLEFPPDLEIADYRRLAPAGAKP